MGKTYYKYLTEYYKTFEHKRLVRFRFNKPRKELTKPYEVLAEQYKLELSSRLYDESNYQDSLAKIVNINEIGLQSLKNLERYVKIYNGDQWTIDKTKIERSEKVGGTHSKRIASFMKDEIRGNPQLLKRVKRLIERRSKKAKADPLPLIG